MKSYIQPLRFILSPLLIILSWVYWLLLRLRSMTYAANLREVHRSSAPVISVGNLSLGGTGKTPVTAYLAKRLAAKGYQVAILTRGYRSAKKNEPLIFRWKEGRIPSPQLAGDEPLMLAEQAPEAYICVFPDRKASAKAIEGRADFLLLDDGLQRLDMKKDLEIVLIDAGAGLGNQRLIPAGPLRLPASELKKADALVLTKTDGRPPEALLELAESMKPGLPLFTQKQHISGFSVICDGTPFAQEMTGCGALLISAIARPENFQKSIEACGVRVLSRIDLPDHADFSAKHIAQAQEKAGEVGADYVISTEKDSVKLTELAGLPDNFLSSKLDCLFEPSFDEFIDRFIESKAKEKNSIN